MRSSGEIPRSCLFANSFVLDELLHTNFLSRPKNTPLLSFSSEDYAIWSVLDHLQHAFHPYDVWVACHIHEPPPFMNPRFASSIDSFGEFPQLNSFLRQNLIKIRCCKFNPTFELVKNPHIVGYTHNVSSTRLSYDFETRKVCQ